MNTPVTFLLVDDLPENLFVARGPAAPRRACSLKAGRATRRWSSCCSTMWPLALIDVQMPGLSGFELAELMRGNERTRRIPIIFVTAGSHSAERRFQGYEAGAVDFIQKPIEPDILRSKTEVFFEIYRQRQMIAEQRDALAAQAQTLQHADRKKDEFLAILAHELRNPLAALQGGLKHPSPPPGWTALRRIKLLMEAR